MNIACQIVHHLSLNIGQLKNGSLSRDIAPIKMFTYFMALIFTPLIIFGLVHARCLNNWLRSKAQNSLIICNGLIRRPRIETLAINEDTEIVCETERLSAQRSLFDTTEESRTDLLTEISETERKFNNINPPSHSFENLHENVLPEIKEREFELSGTRTGKDNLFELFKNTIEKSTNPSAGLNTTQIYNLILKKTVKQNVAKQKLLELERNRVSHTTTLLNSTEDPLSSSENFSEHEDENSENIQNLPLK